MRGAGSCAGSLPVRSTGSAERSTARELAGWRPLVFLDSWLDAADRRNGDTLFLDGIEQGRGLYDEAVEKG